MAKEEEKITAAVAKEYKKLETVLEKVKVKKRPLSAWTIINNKRVKAQRDKIQNIMASWIKNDPEILELH